MATIASTPRNRSDSTVSSIARRGSVNRVVVSGTDVDGEVTATTPTRTSPTRWIAKGKVGAESGDGMALDARNGNAAPRNGGSGGSTRQSRSVAHPGVTRDRTWSAPFSSSRRPTPAPSTPSRLKYSMVARSPSNAASGAVPPIESPVANSSESSAWSRNFPTVAARCGPPPAGRTLPEPSRSSPWNPTGRDSAPENSPIPRMRTDRVSAAGLQGLLVCASARGGEARVATRTTAANSAKATGPTRPVMDVWIAAEFTSCHELFCCTSSPRGAGARTFRDPGIARS